MLKAMKPTERKYGGKKALRNDFEWGMMNGKLSALRWAMGTNRACLYVIKLCARLPLPSRL
jgi:hypothetical protein